MLLQKLGAPDFLRLELANVLSKKVRRGELDQLQALAGIPFADAAVEYLPTTNLELRALEIGLEIKHPIYDCLYLALAEAIGGVIVTADKKMVANAGPYARLVRPLA